MINSFLLPHPADTEKHYRPTTLMSLSTSNIQSPFSCFILQLLRKLTVSLAANVHQLVSNFDKRQLLLEMRAVRLYSKCAVTPKLGAKRG